MEHLKLFANKAAARGAKIPSPCVAKYTAENQVDFFTPMGDTRMDAELWTITAGTGDQNVVSEYCNIGDSEVLRIVASCYNTNGQNPKVADIINNDFTTTHVGKLSGNTQIQSISGLGPVVANSTMLTRFLSQDTEIEYLDVSDWDVSHVEDFTHCFNYLRNIKEIRGIENWDVSHGKRFRCLFQGFTTSSNTMVDFDLSKWQVKAEGEYGIRYLFAMGIYLRSVGDISNWDVSECTSFASMFNRCENLENVGDISKWDVSQGTNFFAIFNRCRKLPSSLLEKTLAKWDWSNAESTIQAYYDNGIRHIIIPPSLKVIGNSMFYRSSDVKMAATKSITLHDNVEIFGAEVFLNQYNIREIHIGKNVRQIGNSAYTATYNDSFASLLEKVTVDSQNQYFKSIGDKMVLSKDGKMFYGGANLYYAKKNEDCIIPEGVEIIVGGALRTCFDSSDTQEVWDNIYYTQGLNERFIISGLSFNVIFPSTTTYIGDRVLQSAYWVPSVTIKATTPPTLQSTTFYSARVSGSKIYVPAESVNAYKAATTWSSYASIIEAIPNS